MFANDPGGVVISRVDIFGGNYDTHGGEHKHVASVSLGSGAKMAEITVPPGYDFYYAAAYKDGNENARAFTAPVWMDNL